MEDWVLGGYGILFWLYFLEVYSKEDIDDLGYIMEVFFIWLIFLYDIIYVCIKILIDCL